MPADSGRAAPDLEPGAVVGGPRTGARVAGAHDAGELVGGPRPVELELLDGQLVGVGGLAGLRLAAWWWGRPGACSTSSSVPDADQPRPQLARGLVEPIGARGARVHRPGVEAGLERHDAHAGLGVAGEDRPLDRRRAPPARQQREVHVHEPVRQRVEQRLREDLAERDDHAELGPGRGDLVDDLARLLGREHRQAERLRGLLHRARLGSLPRPRRRSGWVTTSATSCPASGSAWRTGTASAGVPKKTRRTASVGRG